MYVIRTRDLDLDQTHTWQRAGAPKYLASGFRPFVTGYSVYPTLRGAQRQRDALKLQYAFCIITVEELT